MKKVTYILNIKVYKPLEKAPALMREDESDFVSGKKS